MLALTLDGQGTLQGQLYRALRDALLQRRLRSGERLPGTRALAQQQAVARNTVLAVYAQLEAEGYLQARRGSGFLVLALPALRRQPAATAGEDLPRCSGFAGRAVELLRERMRPAQASAPRLDLRYGLPLPAPELLIGWQRALAWAAQRAAPDYPDAAGLQTLRQALANWLGQRRGFAVDPAQIVIVSGAQQALDLCVRVLGSPGTTAVIEDPHYQGTRQLLQCAGLPWRAIPVDAAGLRAELLPAQPGTLLFVTPAHQFPSGVVLSPARRLQILEWARRHRCWVVEDDYDGEFRYDAQPLPALKALDRDDRVIHVGTFSKTLFPALRLGFLVVPAALREAFVAVKWLNDRGNAAIEQLALARLIESGRFAALLRLASRQLAQRRQALLVALAAHLSGFGLRIDGGAAGMHVCVWFEHLPARCAPAVVHAAAAAGVGVYPVTPYFSTPPDMLGLLLGYAALPVAEIAEAVRRLESVLTVLQVGQEPGGNLDN